LSIVGGFSPRGKDWQLGTGDWQLATAGGDGSGEQPTAKRLRLQLRRLKTRNAQFQVNGRWR